MSNKTIAKFGGVVILFACCCAFFIACSHAPMAGDRYVVNSAELSTDYAKPVIIGTIESKDIIESSGLAASPCQPNVLWTHNDAGDDAFIFALNLQGRHLGTWRVTNSNNVDWEDMAAYKDPSGTCYLYLGDIGNNKLDRSVLRVYRVKEPPVQPDGAKSSKKSPLESDAAEFVAFKYSDTPHNAETLMAHPQTGDIYVLTKRLDGPSLVFKIKPAFGSAEAVVGERIGEVSLPAVPNGLLTGGVIAPDGKLVVVCDYSAGYELKLGTGANFDDVWKQKPIPIDLGDRKQGEAVTFRADGTSIIATSEKRNAPLFEIKRK
ncbi:MAG TPA: hypothetical protein VFZ23_07595 [Pyrinomonadaceae bacterium]